MMPTARHPTLRCRRRLLLVALFSLLLLPISSSSLTLVSTIDGFVFAYDSASPESSSNPLWSTNVGGTTIKSFQDSNSLEPIGLIVPGSDGSIYVQNSFSKQLQRYPISVSEFVDQGPMYQMLPNGRRLVIVGSTESRVFQIDASTGQFLGVFSSSQDLPPPAPVAPNSNPIILISRHDFRVRAFDEESGHEMWNFTYGVLDTPAQVDHKHFEQIEQAWTGSTPVRSVSTRLAAPGGGGGRGVSTFAPISGSPPQVVALNRLELPGGLVQLYASPGVMGQDRAVVAQHHVVLPPLELEGPRPAAASPLQPPAAPLLLETLILAVVALALLLLLAWRKLNRAPPPPLQQQQQQQQPALAVPTGQISINTSKIKGRGCNGTIVFEGTFQSRPVAVKRMQTALYDRANKEVDVLIQSEGHLNVVRYLAKEETPDFVYLALELCVMTVDQAVDEYKQSLHLMPPGAQPGDAMRLFLKELASATEHLHCKGIVHCDIKPQNVLVVPRRAATSATEQVEFGALWIPKLSDMGLSKSVERERSSFRMTPGPGRSGAGGTLGWRAPELLMPHATARVSRKIDVFSLGCLFFYILELGRHPFGEWLARDANIEASNPVELERLLGRAAEAHSLIKQMIAPHAAARPPMAACLAHPLLWPAKVRLEFLCDVSDRLEAAEQAAQNQMEVLGCELLGPQQDWTAFLDASLQQDVTSTKFRTYDGRTVRDLLRYIRNKKHHREEELSEVLTHNADVFMGHFTGPGRFPRLVMVCCEWLGATRLALEPNFAQMLGEGLNWWGGRWVAGQRIRGWYADNWAQRTSGAFKMPVAKNPKWKSELCLHWTKSGGTSCHVGDNCVFAHGPIELRLVGDESPSALDKQPTPNNQRTQGPTSRPWFVPNWQEIGSSLAEVIVFGDKFKRALCQHWERTGGTSCVMGEKCAFAHGLVELRNDGRAIVVAAAERKKT